MNERIAKIESKVMDISEKMGMLILHMQNGEEMGMPASRNSSVMSIGAMDGYRGTTASECKFMFSLLCSISPMERNGTGMMAWTVDVSAAATAEESKFLCF